MDAIGTKVYKWPLYSILYYFYDIVSCNNKMVIIITILYIVIEAFIIPTLPGACMVPYKRQEGSSSIDYPTPYVHSLHSLLFESHYLCFVNVFILIYGNGVAL